MDGRWRCKAEDARAAKQQGDPEALAREGDPRGGAPQEGESVEERRSRDR